MTLGNYLQQVRLQQETYCFKTETSYHWYPNIAGKLAHFLNFDLSVQSFPKSGSIRGLKTVSEKLWDASVNLGLPGFLFENASRTQRSTCVHRTLFIFPVQHTKLFDLIFGPPSQVHALTEDYTWGVAFDAVIVLRLAYATSGYSWWGVYCLHTTYIIKNPSDHSQARGRL